MANDHSKSHGENQPFAKNLNLWAAMFLLALAFFLSACSNKSVKLIAPVDQPVIRNNMPYLAWHPVECDNYEVWVNDILMDSLPPYLNNYTVFPLSYGKHTWYIVAVTKNGEMKSKQGQFTIEDQPLETLPANATLIRNNWAVESSHLLGKNGAVLSLPGIDVSGWYATSTPATVLTALVRNGVYPNPYIGKNNMLIPDANDVYNERHDLLKYSHIPGINPWSAPYWYRTTFNVPANYEGKTVWITFNEINYKAEIWLNGVMIADNTAVAGMERKFTFNITPYIKQNGENVIAVAIYPVTIPGDPAPEPLEPFGDPGTNMADGMIALNYTKWDAVGWDWQPAIRDRDMGITEDVFLWVSDDILIENLYVSSLMQLPDTTRAELTLEFDLVNNSPEQMSGTVQATIESLNGNTKFSIPFSVLPDSAQTVLLNSSDVAQLLVKDPLLWWPLGYGNPNLYKLSLKAETTSGQKSEASTNFGIRQVETYIGDHSRVFKINGREIYLRGGNWVLDMMLNWTASRYENEILLAKNSNLNILRVWGPTGAPPKAFFDAADKHGVLIWQDFLNDYWGTFRNTPGFQPPADLFELASIDIIKKYRNHPSLIIWCGGNEGVNPREALLLDLLAKYDPRGTRPYLTQSDGDGLHGGGPYHTISPDEFFTHYKLTGFSSEIGPSGVPVFESQLKFIHKPGEDYAPSYFPISGQWAYHDANNWPGEDTRKFTSYDSLVRLNYGLKNLEGLAGVEEYADKSQMVNYDVYRASIESINHQIWNGSTGILLWKANSSWPSLVWQVWDWYMQAHAGFYGTRKAAAPIHIQLNRHSNDIVVINSTNTSLTNAHVEMTIYDLQAKKISEINARPEIKANGVTNTGLKAGVPEGLHFLKAILRDSNGNLIAESFYWLSPENDFSGIDNLGQARLDVTCKRESLDGWLEIDVAITNTGSDIAFMTALKVVGAASGHEILPTLWSDNYVSLLPDETRVVTARIAVADIYEDTVISVKSYNMEKAVRVNI